MSYKVVQIKSIQPPEIAVQLDTGEYVLVSCSPITVDPLSGGLTVIATATQISKAGKEMKDANGMVIIARHSVHEMGDAQKETIVKTAVLAVLGEASDPGIRRAIKVAAQTGEPDLESIL